MSSFFCPACGARPPSWAPGPGGRPSARCPECNSLERHRFLVRLVQTAATMAPAVPQVVLDFAPSTRVHAVLHDVFPEASIVGIDLLEPDRDIDLLADLTSLPIASQSADLILCYHVLEHIPDDRTAMRELRRVLSPKGLALLQVPYRPGRATDEDPDAPAPERIERFGQEDHVRWYGRDFDDRLADCGWDARRLRVGSVIPEETRREHGLADREWVWLGAGGAGGLQWRRALVQSLNELS